MLERMIEIVLPTYKIDIKFSPFIVSFITFGGCERYCVSAGRWFRTDNVRPRRNSNSGDTVASLSAPLQTVSGHTLSPLLSL